MIVFGASAPDDARAKTSRRVVERPANLPSDRRPTRRRCGSPRDASRLRTAARLRCEPSHFASSTGVRPRVPSSFSIGAATPSCRSAVVGTRTRAIGGARDLSSPHRKKRRCARKQFSASLSLLSGHRAIARSRA